MKARFYELNIFQPGISGYHKKTGEPFGIEPEISFFKANSHTEAATTAFNKYRQTGLKSLGHYNVSLASSDLDGSQCGGY